MPTVDFDLPGLDRTPDILDDPSTELLGDPTNNDGCDCTKDKKKKKRKPKERDVCMQGTYTQRKKGIKYAPRRMVPCEGVIEKEKTTTKKPRRRRRTTTGDLARDVFNLP